MNFMEYIDYHERVAYGDEEAVSSWREHVTYRDSRNSKCNPLSIQKVIFNDPATIVFWKDGTKTVVKCGENDIYDPEKGLAMAISKKALGNKGNYYDEFKKWVPDMKHSCETCKHRNTFVLDQPCFKCMVTQEPIGYEPINTKK